MTWLIKQRFSRLSRQAAPDPVFKRALHKTLTDAGHLPLSSFHVFFLSWKRVGIALTLVAGLAVGTASYAYTSPNVLPDHPLYPLRTALERIQVSVAVTPEARERIKLNQLHRRIEETRLLVKKDKPIAAAHVEKVVNQVEQAVEEHPATSSEAAARQKFLRESVDLDKQEITEIADDQAVLEDPESKTLVNQLLIDEADRLDEHVKILEKDDTHTQGKKERVLSPSEKNGAEGENDEQYEIEN